MEPLQILQQGSFAAGGAVLRHPGEFAPHSTEPAGQTLHGDHAYATFQIPVNARRFPIAFLHGDGQSGRCWHTTADGREGFQNIFLRQRHSVYLIDQPRRGAAGQSTLPATNMAIPNDQAWYEQFRIGIWPDMFPGVQFSDDPVALDQYFRHITPNTGPYDVEVVSAGVAAVFDKIGPAILVSHSQGGGLGWGAVIKTPNIRAVVSYEPGSGFIFPEGEAPAPMPSSGGDLHALEVPAEQFQALTRIPIILFYGDYIPEEPSANRGQDIWRVRLAMARLWAEAVNRRGGDATVIHLPSLGIMGNTHFPFSDLNNVEIADLMTEFLHDKQLDV
ncbi:alpha/beta fold hydrolase [Sphingobium sp. H39-3-25]|uniref:alpha/beta hydrolase n=1 Tax=Sphingobium arseniciresistens TaxID=3030834 RepID=UPI0023B9BC19|nr:alpha/beta fold hydrolase [Sphingobium arseniciresistens]